MIEATALDLRRNLKSLFKAVERNETVRITYRGRTKALLVPPTQGAAEQVPPVNKDHPFFGMWADREDMKDVAAYVRNLRKPRHDDLRH